MKPENFCYWLQGWLEIQNPNHASPEQLQEIKNHLALVFNKVTPLVRGEAIAEPYRIVGETPISIGRVGIPAAGSGTSFGELATAKELHGSFQLSC